MTNRGSFPAAPLVLLAVLWGACGKDPKAAQMAALEDAYKSGVLTKAEYDTKKAALMAPAQIAALEDAYKSGVLTKEEYEVKKAALVGSAPAATSVVAAPAPAQPARPAPVTPATPVAEALAAPATPAPPAAPGKDGVPGKDAPAGKYMVMKRAEVVDQYGYERPMPTLSMLVPSDWQVQGATTWNVKDTCNTIQTRLVASGPDGRGIEVFPHYAWAWADNPRFLQQDYQQKASMGSHACDVMPLMGASDYLRRTLPRLRPAAQVVGMEPMPKLLQAMQQQAAQTEQMGRQYGVQQRVRSDVVRARLRYSLKGQPVEEWLVAITTITGTQGPFGATYNCGAVSFAERAPQGQLDGNGKFYDMLVASTRVNPEWQARVNGTQANIFKTEHEEIRKRSEINTQLSNDLSKIRREAWDNKQRSEDHVFGQYSQATLGIETYRNPTTGETWDLSNTYSHAWVNDRNEIVLTDQEGWDPNTVLKGNWTALQHVRQ